MRMNGEAMRHSTTSVAAMVSPTILPTSVEAAASGTASPGG